jgi:hypothetical protein
MPTPFTHLANAQRLMTDSHLPNVTRQFLTDQWGAFLFGSIAPDSQHKADLRRADTHFFAYRFPVTIPPAVAMLQEFPQLENGHVQDASHRAFLAGYLGHLAMDEIWWVEFLYPIFGEGDWASYRIRNFILHALLGIVDDEDYQRLQPDIYPALHTVKADHWLPFISDKSLMAWRDIVTEQLAPGGKSATLEILGSRVDQGIEGLKALLNDPARVQAEIWHNVPPQKLATTQDSMYKHMRQTILQYLDQV